MAEFLIFLHHQEMKQEHPRFKAEIEPAWAREIREPLGGVAISKSSANAATVLRSLPRKLRDDFPESIIFCAADSSEHYIF
jgi:hypothetical protein